MTNKKYTIASAESLRRKSDDAIGAFRKLVSGLRTTNEEAVIAKAANEELIEKFKQENAEIDLLTSQNEKIIQNVESLLSV